LSARFNIANAPAVTMFTGLIENVGRIAALQQTAGKLRLSVASELPLGEVKVGDSVAIDGCCLTVVDKAAGTLTFDAADETLRRTSLSERRVGDAVHLERAMRADGRFDGHIVQGHIDGVGKLTARRPDGEALWLDFAVPSGLARYMVEKGGIAIDGVSLTLTAVGESSCAVMLIPHSQEKTHLGKKAVGAAVNIEVDVLAKYVERLLRK
jgi:riboflavin synthase